MMVKSFFKNSKTLLKETYNNIWEDNLSLHSAGIAFYTIFSAAPLLVIIISSLDIFLGSQQARHQTVVFLSQIMGKDMANLLLNMSQSSGSGSSGWLASIVAVVISLFGAATVITQLKTSLNAIWETEAVQANSILLYLFNRLLSLVIIGVILAILLGSMLLEQSLTLFSASSLVPHFWAPFFPLLTIAISIMSMIIFFLLIYKILPDVKARWRDIFVGACITTVLFLIGQYLVGLYLSSASLQASYKTAGSFVVFLIWIYYNVQVVLVGAEFTQTYARLFGQEFSPATSMRVLPWG